MTLRPAVELARISAARYPNESAEYRRARTALLAEEIELRRHIERVAEQRRQLPPGGEVTTPYAFEGEQGRTDFAGLFGDKPTLVVYSYMFGPQRAEPCPMCTSLLSAWDGEAPDITQRVALAIVARSPIERLVAVKRARGWRHLPLFTDLTGAYSGDYHGLSPDGGDGAAFNVFSRRDGRIRHFWGGEMFAATADPGQDSRGAPDLMPLWTILDTTPEGRGSDWYPQIELRLSRSGGPAGRLQAGRNTNFFAGRKGGVVRVGLRGQGWRPRGRRLSGYRRPARISPVY